MNDHEAIDAINKIMDQYCDGELRELTALSRIARVLGGRRFEDMEGKEQK